MINVATPVGLHVRLWCGETVSCRSQESKRDHWLNLHLTFDSLKAFELAPSAEAAVKSC